MMIKYDANKQYKWEETDKFVMNGNQFGLILNAFRNSLSKPEAQEVMLMMKAEKEMTNILSLAVEDGLVKEMPAQEIADARTRPQQKTTQPKRKTKQTVKK